MENNKTNVSIKINKENFLKLPEVAGVYTFWKDKDPIYIGKSVNLKSRLNSYLAITLGIKTAKMVSEADEVSYVEVNSDLESLLLESYLIKKHKPKYNIVLKDDKHALYIVITNEEFPRVLAVRKIISDELKPKAVFGPFPSSTNVKIILKMVRKIFPYSDHKVGKRPCLYSHLGLCNPCPNEVAQSTQHVVLRKKYLNNIRNIKLVLSRKFNVVRNGLETEMNKLSKLQKYEEAKVVRDRIKTLDYITQEKISVEQFLENPNLTEDVRNQELESLGKLVSLDKIGRIECFDIAHLSGVSATASMVVLIDGEKENSEYRHFKVKQQNGQSDFDSMREISERRLKNLDKWGRPDLIIVDGGLGQVKIFDKVFKQLAIPVVGIAKHPDRLVFPDGKKIRLIGLPLQIVSRIRDEAHRFARRLHHKLLSKNLLP
ncbi:MAG: GIY-YIG nuclease family protein [Microgenomates group bacterium]